MGAMAVADEWGNLFFRSVQLMYLLLPVYLANMAPPFSRFWKGWNPPISRRWLGAHKTVLGFLSGVVVAMVVARVQRDIQWHGQLLSYSDWPVLGFACGVGALGGDSIKSFFKRCLGIAPGRAWIPADQLDFVVGGLIALSGWVHFSAWDVMIVIALSFFGDILVNHLSFYLGIRDTKW